MNAREMFERLGYTRNLDSKKLIYTKALKGMFRYFEITFDLTEKEIELYDDLEAYTINNALLKAIQQQLKELGWIEPEQKQETNFEHYKDGIIEVCVDELAISKGKVVECCAIPCSECDFEDKNGHCIGNHEIMKWLKQPYKKLPYKLSQWEYDLLNAYKNSGMRQCISNYGTLLEMYGKGHFKGIDTSTPIHEILDNCKVV